MLKPELVFKIVSNLPMSAKSLIAYSGKDTEK